MALCSALSYLFNICWQTLASMSVSAPYQYIFFFKKKLFSYFIVGRSWDFDTVPADVHATKAPWRQTNSTLCPTFFSQEKQTIFFFTIIASYFIFWPIKHVHRFQYPVPIKLDQCWPIGPCLMKHDKKDDMGQQKTLPANVSFVTSTQIKL